MTEQAQTFCVDCKEPTSGGLRCKRCHGQLLARRALVDTADDDREILRMVNEENISGQRLGARLGVTRVRGHQKIRLARQREARRVELGIS